jgi:hypothetical protein
MMKVKLKISSSSLVKRMRKDGGPPEELDSGSCEVMFSIKICFNDVCTNLDIFDNTFVSPLSFCAVPGGGESIRSDAQKGAVAGIGD